MPERIDNQGPEGIDHKDEGTGNNGPEGIDHKDEGTGNNGPERIDDQGDEKRIDDKGDEIMKKGSNIEGKSNGNGVLACNDVRQNLAAYLAGELSVNDSNLIRTHLRKCRSCKQALAVETNLNRVIREAVRPRVAPGYWDRLWPQVQASLIERRSSRPRLWRPRQSLRWRPRLSLRWAFAVAATAATFIIFLVSRPAIAPTLPSHDASHYADMPAVPTVVLEQNDDERVTYELAGLTVGNPTPTQRVMVWHRMEGL